MDDFKETRKYWKIERRSTRSHSVVHSVYKRLWTCRKADHIMIE